MGNYCYEDPRSPQLKAEETYTRKQIILQQASHFMPNSMVVSQLRSLPPISKQILNRVQELGPFLNKGFKDLGHIYQLRNKSVYQGFLKNKLFHGPGRLILSDGSMIQSQFQNGQPKNTTRIFKPNGDYFSGKISDNGMRQHGIVYEKGIKFQGDMINQKPHGYGRQTAKNYAYSGTYENGKKINGFLQWNLQNPKHIQSYEGAFVDNQFHGPGTLINHDGKYVGNFQGGQKNGYGIFQDTAGRRYQGMFRKNKQQGEGKLYGPDRTLISQGKWMNGKFITQ